MFSTRRRGGHHKLARGIAEPTSPNETNKKKDCAREGCKGPGPRTAKPSFSPGQGGRGGSLFPAHRSRLSSHVSALEVIASTNLQLVRAASKSPEFKPAAAVWGTWGRKGKNAGLEPGGRGSQSRALERRGHDKGIMPRRVLVTFFLGGVCAVHGCVPLFFV
ncbi:hypothetical protein B0J13DRAFT_562608 [Dactylonectria estremocensis]|uniref:Uncharacterized protein n=1 Tax=Dactylonectria estremocensis TaxID=1079267 RepID=A0A9P9E5S5_9HYPO|nr:hypothetical protein B0J13DRAFT_562608 [Dactylonectria estremocensis]